MRSDRGRALELLRSQGLGVLCGGATVVLLAVGSFVLDRTRDGASAGIALDDLRPFFERPAAAHAWMYLLVPVLALYALNTLLGTWHAVARKLRAGVRAPAAYGPAVIHVGFLLALLAHGVGGLWGVDRGTVVMAAGGAWQPLADGREARLLDVTVETLPGGMPRSARVELEVRDATGRVGRAEVGYNAPLTTRLATELHLLGDVGRARVAELTVAGARCAAVEGDACEAGGVRVEALTLAAPGQLRAEAMARVAVGGRQLWLSPGVDVPLGDGRPLRLEGVREAPAVLLRARSTPGNPIALAGAIAVAVGLAMMARRFVPGKGRAGEEEAEIAEAA
jgi:hypothetical protein